MGALPAEGSVTLAGRHGRPNSTYATEDGRTAPAATGSRTVRRDRSTACGDAWSIRFTDKVGVSRWSRSGLGGGSRRWHGLRTVFGLLVGGPPRRSLVSDLWRGDPAHPLGPGSVAPERSAGGCRTGLGGVGLGSRRSRRGSGASWAVVGGVGLGSRRSRRGAGECRAGVGGAGHRFRRFGRWAGECGVGVGRARRRARPWTRERRTVGRAGRAGICAAPATAGVRAADRTTRVRVRPASGVSRSAPGLADGLSAARTR